MIENGGLVGGLIYKTVSLPYEAKMVVYLVWVASVQILTVHFGHML